MYQDPILPDVDEDTVVTCDMLKGWDTSRCSQEQHLMGEYDACFKRHYPLEALHPTVGGRRYSVKLCTPALRYAQGWDQTEKGGEDFGETADPR